MITDTQKIKINEIIASTEGFLNRIEKGVVQAQEATDYFATQIAGAKDTFDNTTDEWRIIDRWEHENGFHIHGVSKSGYYAGKHEVDRFVKLLEVFRKLVPTGVSLITKNEFHFTSKDVYEAKRFFVSLFRSAGSEIVIVDEHLDAQFFDYIDVVSDAVKIQVITGDQKPMFWNLFSALRTKRLNIEARVNSVSHCRYIVIDNTFIYSTDASLNTIGKKDFMVHKLEDSEEITKVKKEIIGYWNNAKIK